MAAVSSPDRWMGAATSSAPSSESLTSPTQSRADSISRAFTSSVVFTRTCSPLADRTSSATSPWATSFPLEMMVTLSQTCSTSCSRWLDNSTVRFPSPRPCISSRTWIMPSGSRPLVGSSRHTISGSPRRA